VLRFCHWYSAHAECREGEHCCLEPGDVLRSHPRRYTLEGGVRGDAPEHRPIDPEMGICWVSLPAAFRWEGDGLCAFVA